ncbi:hypothetical protein SAMN05421747_101445 [Parapedobacter composti]|uniref:Uncharacterized protein n=1 Tax=Parapedobacter composti TaxID=623281 RepID=A0A1I1EG81_9SPHI|nr:hypothetical protein [Parapedobacter composti]SFB83980.1 hypothetical protein SAMN05421747_101445 [Parapedobacter composti]
MKKYLTPVVGFIVILGVSSCRKTEVIENYYPNPNKSFVYERAANEWNTDGSQIWLELNLPELDSYFMNQGGVQISMSQDDESTYDILPATFDQIAYSVNYRVGRITIYGQDPLADPGVSITPPDYVFIKIVLMETDYIE